MTPDAARANLAAVTKEAEALVTTVLAGERGLSAQLVQECKHPRVLALVLADVVAYSLGTLTKVSAAGGFRETTAPELWQGWLLHQAASNGPKEGVE